MDTPIERPQTFGFHTIRSWVRSRVPARLRRTLAKQLFLRDGVWTVNRLTEIRGAPDTSLVRWATAEDLPLLQQFCTNERINMVDRDRVLSGSEFTAVALRNGEIVGFEVYARHRFFVHNEPWLHCILHANEALAVRVYVARELRGQRIAHELIAFAACDFRRRGIETV